jgi:exodeoxyribonuclease VII small subunit
MLLASQGIRKDVSEKDFSQLSFEQALIALEEVVQQLESGSVPLDQSITLYERGEKLRKLCQARLDDAQARIEKIVTDANGAASSTVPFDADG